MGARIVVVLVVVLVLDLGICARKCANWRYLQPRRWVVTPPPTAKTSRTRTIYAVARILGRPSFGGRRVRELDLLRLWAKAGDCGHGDSDQAANYRHGNAVVASKVFG